MHHRRRRREKLTHRNTETPPISGRAQRQHPPAARLVLDRARAARSRIVETASRPRPRRNSAAVKLLRARLAAGLAAQPSGKSGVRRTADFLRASAATPSIAIRGRAAGQRCGPARHCLRAPPPEPQHQLGRPEPRAHEGISWPRAEAGRRDDVSADPEVVGSRGGTWVTAGGGELGGHDGTDAAVPCGSMNPSTTARPRQLSSDTARPF